MTLAPFSFKDQEYALHPHLSVRGCNTANRIPSSSR